MHTPTRPYFAYGSNLNRADMRMRCPSARPATRARLDGWRLTFRGVADIEPAQGRAVHGALWWVSDDDIRSLDRYEGAPSSYRQALVEVETHDGPVVAMTYVMTHRARAAVGVVPWPHRGRVRRMGPAAVRAAPRPRRHTRRPPASASTPSGPTDANACALGSAAMRPS